jgi:hypothetical protein
MAYQAFSEGVGGLVVDRVLPAEPRVAFSALEWSVIALAERDRPSSLREPGRVASALGAVFGFSRSPRLADERLEALRRIALLSWRRGYSVESQEVRSFLAAGFTAAQYELLVDSIAVARTSRRLAA